MPYHSKTDISRTIPDYTLTALADDEGMNVADQSIIDEIIAQTDGEIDGYLGSRYSVPLTTAPALVRSIACRITIYKLYARKHDDVPESRRTDYQDALKQLESLRDGVLLISTGAVAGDYQEYRDLGFTPGMFLQKDDTTFDAYLAACVAEQGALLSARIGAAAFASVDATIAALVKRCVRVLVAAELCQRRINVVNSSSEGVAGLDAFKLRGSIERYREEAEVLIQRIVTGSLAPSSDYAGGVVVTER